MNKKILIIHIGLFIINLLILLGSIALFLIKWNSLPSEIGIHFGADGDFDVVAAKMFGFYPHIIGGIITAGMAVAFRLIRRRKTGLRISEKGEMIFKSELILTLDLIHMLLVVFFAVWTRSVCYQIPLDTNLVIAIAFAVLAVSAVGIIAEIITCCIHRIKPDNAGNSGLGHRLARLVAWLLTFGGVWTLAESWVRFPGDEELYYDPDYYGLAYFADLGTYLDKHFLLIPQVLIFVILSVLEAISVKAVKGDKRALVKLTDSLKLFSGIFFFIWNILLCSEETIGIASVGIFAVLCGSAFILYGIRKKKDTGRAE